MTPFLCAIKNCSLNTIKYLVENDSNIHATSIPLFNVLF